MLDHVQPGARLSKRCERFKPGRKDQAEVIAGIVLEDTVRRICRLLGVIENGVALDTLISELTKRDPPVLTSFKAKHAPRRRRTANFEWTREEAA